MKPAIVPIVEGLAEVQSVPVLLRRIQEAEGSYEASIARPFRVKRSRVVRPGELERAIKQAVRSREGAAAVLVILDADDDCPARLGPDLLERGRKATHLPVAVVLANRELEAWLLASKESLRGKRGIRQDAVAPQAPETIRGAKERLSKNMQDRRYIETDDQVALVANMDISLAARRSPSFARLLREVRRLLRHLAERRTDARG